MYEGLKVFWDRGGACGGRDDSIGTEYSEAVEDGSAT